MPGVAFALTFCTRADRPPPFARLLFGVNNRGDRLLLGAFNNQGGSKPTTLADLPKG